MTQVSELLRGEFPAEAYSNTMPIMPCDGVDGYMVERIGRDSYCLTLPAPGFEAEDIEVTADRGFLRITGDVALSEKTGQILHYGLDCKLDRTFMMLRPLDATGIETRRGLLRIFLQEHPGAGLRTLMPPDLSAAEALALAA